MLQIQSIIKLTSWIITLPFYIYAFLKWHQFKGHFLIRKRFPLLSCTLFCIAFLGQTLSLIEDCLFDYNISSQNAHTNISYAVLSLNFAISGLVLYRINLVYLKWKSIHQIPTPKLSLSNRPNAHSNSSKTVNSTKPIIKNISSISTGTADPNINVNENIPTEPEQPKASTPNPIKDIHNNIYSSKLSLIILFFIFIGTLIPYLSNTLSATNDIAFAIVTTELAVLWILIALSIFNIKHHKVQEGIGCIKECYAILLSLLVQMLLQLVTPVCAYVRAQLLQYITFFVLHFGAIVTLYIPLILLLKAEGTLNVKKFHYTTDGKLFQDASICMDVNLNSNNNSDILHELPAIQTPPNARNTDTQWSENKKNDVVFVNKCLFHFLYRNQHNVGLFADYLRHCWCSENLLFIERASIFYQIVLKLQQNYQLSLIKINNKGLAPLETEDRISNLSLPSIGKNGHSLTLTLSNTGATNSLSFRYSETHSSNQRVSAVYVRPNGELTTPPNDLNDQIDKNNKTGTPTMTPVTPIPKTFNNWNDVKNSKNAKQETFAELKYIYRFEFEYLQQIYNNYQQIINKHIDNNSDNNYQIGGYRKALYIIAKEIYDQFISSGSDTPTQVNLGYEVTVPLKYLLDNYTSEKLDKFQDYDNFLRLFDGAVIQTYRLLINVYNFRFRKYVKKQFKDVVFEK